MTNLPPEIEAFVAAARVGHLATVDARGRPHLVPVCFAYSDGRVYSVLDAKPKRVAAGELQRLRNIRANPQVQLLVDRYDEDWRRLAYVQLRGRAAIIEDGPVHADALARLRARYHQYATMALDGRPLIVLTVERAVAWGDLTP